MSETFEVVPEGLPLATARIAWESGEIDDLRVLDSKISEEGVLTELTVEMTNRPTDLTVIVSSDGVLLEETDESKARLAPDTRFLFEGYQWCLISVTDQRGRVYDIERGFNDWREWQTSSALIVN